MKIDSMTTTRHRIWRMATALLGAVPVIGLILVADPTLTRSLSRQEASYAGEDFVADENPVSHATRTFGKTTRICRYRGVEWLVESRHLPENVDDALNSLSRELSEADQEISHTMPLIPSLIAQVHELSPETADMRALWRNNSGRRTALVLAIAFDTDSGTQLVTMESATFDLLPALSRPPDSAALRSELENYIRLIPASMPIDAIENELDIGTSKIYFVRNPCSSKEAADWYTSIGIAGLRSDAASPSVDSFIQTVEIGGAEVQLFHQMDMNRASRSLTLIRIWKGRRANA